MATAKNNISDSGVEDKDSLEGNDRLHDRLHDDSNLVHRRVNNSDETFEFVNSKDQMSTSKNLNISTPNDAISTDSSLIYHQRSKISSDEGSSTGENVKNNDSGGAIPKIKEKDLLSNNDSSCDSNKVNTDNLGATANEAKSQSQNETTEDSNANAAYECNICLDVARDAVISMCGHLFCWPCLHTWLETRPNRQICPVCKAGIGKDKVVPLYGRDDSNPKDPREKPVPPRPKGQRPEPESTGGSTFGGFGGFGGGAGNGFQMSFGIGAFPFGFFATNFNLGESGHTHAHGVRGHGTGAAPEGSAQFEEEQFLHKVFLWVALLFIFWLLVA